VALFKKQEKEPEALPVRVDVTFGDPTGKRARLAARSGDAPTLLTLIEAATDPYEREFVLHAALHGINRAPWLDNLPNAFPDRPIAWLVRGAHSIHWAWQAVGNQFTPSTDATAQALCLGRLELADSDLLHATRVLDEDPAPWALLVETGYGLRLDFEEVCNRFDEADQRAHWMYLAHHRMLQATCSRHGGNDDTMLAFARDVVANAPEGSPCLDLIATAHLERWRSERAADDSVTMATVFNRPQVFDEISLAAKRSVESTSFDDGRSAVGARNVFALVLAEAGETERAREQFSRIGDRATEYPWIYQHPDPGLAFARARQRLMGPETP
jgi:hypothetical protein